MAIRLKREQGDPSLASGERFSRTEGKTPAFVDGEVQRLLDAIAPCSPRLPTLLPGSDPS